MEQVDILVIGAGLTGLTVGYELSKMPYTYRLLEKSGRPGGVIRTVKKDGFLYETGPNTGIIGSPELGVILQELKNDLVVQTGEESVKRRLILKNGKWEPLPSGLLAGITTPLFTLRDKFRLLTEPFRKRGVDENETLDHLVLRRMGKSFLDYAIDPFILGVYAGDPSLLVTKYAFPKLFALEQNYGSFIGGSIKKARIPKTEAEKLATREVFSFEDGLEKFIEVLAEKTGKDKILTDVDDFVLHAEENGFGMNYLQNGKQYQIKSRVVITALNATSMMPSQFPFIPESFFETMSKVQYAPTVEVVVGFKKWTGMPLNAFGGLIPHREKRELLGVLFLSAFLPGRAPDGGALLTVFLGGVRRPEWINASDEHIKETVERELRVLMQLKEFEPDLFEIIRHPGAIPQYSFESQQKLEEVQKLSQLHKGFVVGGNALDGIGIADRVKQGVQMANRTKNILKSE